MNIRKNSSNFHILSNKSLGTLVTNSFRTLTGGTLYYDFRNLIKPNKSKKNINYFLNPYFSFRYKSNISHRTILWLGEEVYKVDCEQGMLFVENGDFISEGFELLPEIFSKTSGIVKIQQKNNQVKQIIIKSGLVYEGQQFKNIAQKIYYPGEILFSNIPINKLSFCDHIIGNQTEQLLIRPIEIYEVPYLNSSSVNSQNMKNLSALFKLETQNIYPYKPNQHLKGRKNLDLIQNKLTLKTDKLLINNINFKFKNNIKINSVDIIVNEKLNLNNYISPYLRYKNLKPCLLVQKTQFIDSYTLLSYLEDITLNSLEIVKFKIKKKDGKQILLISNKDCLTLEKRKFPNKKLNDFITISSNVNEIGKIIIENRHYFTLQKGKPYFFPNCKTDNLRNKINLQYKLIVPNRIKDRLKTDRSISLKFSNRLNSKLFVKKDGKLYSSLIPTFLKKLSIRKVSSKLKFGKYKKVKKKADLERTLLIKSLDLVENKLKKSKDSLPQLELIQIVQDPEAKKFTGLYSITEDFFEQDLNSVFCKNSQFIEDGETIGLLNLEKEITGDIVQGLPRIEEILEARKKNLSVKRIPASQKKGLLVQKTSLDPSFEFRKLGTTIQENQKINPHKLLKTYFNYYGLSYLTESIKSNRLVDNYEGSYKSLKKVQTFILKSVQDVYKSQGVTINDKHLEVIIKQMTTKILITSEGNTPLLRREVVDLYHIKHINQIVSLQKKQPAYYVPLVLGITKAALNNPSFISAASFQETTRVLTKAAIEGRIDWLRGLKENIIIGHLIPAGTGSQNYQNSFKIYSTTN